MDYPCFRIFVLLLVFTFVFDCHVCGERIESTGKEKNLLKNSSFEHGMEFWGQGNGVDNNIKMAKIDNKMSFSGKSSVVLNTIKGSEKPAIYQNVEEVVPGANYIFECQVKGNPGPVTTNGGLMITFFNKNDERTTNELHSFLPVMADWQNFEVSATAPQDAVKIQVTAMLYVKGPLWYDEFNLYIGKNPPAFTFAPAKKVLEPAVKSTVVYDVLYNDIKLLKENNISFKLKDNDEKLVCDLYIDDKNETKVEIEIPALRAGNYKIVGFANNKEIYSTYLYVKVDDRKPTRLTEDGILLVDGKKRFPIGLYGVALTALDGISNKGFNTYQGWHGNDFEKLEAKITESEKNNMFMGFHCYAYSEYVKNIPYTVKKLEKFKGRKGVGTWWIADEPDRHPIEEYNQLPECYRILKEQEKDEPFAIVISQPNEYKFGIHFCDILKVDPYWYPHGNVKQVGAAVKKAVALAEPWQPIYAVLQAGYMKNPINQPPYKQCRAAVYLSVINGAKGIYWFTYQMGAHDWKLKGTDLWRNFGKLNKETAYLGNIVINCEASDGIKIVKGQETQVLEKKIDSEDVYYIIVCNPGNKSEKLEILAGKRLEISSLSQRKFEYIDSKAIFELKPLDADVIIIKIF